MSMVGQTITERSVLLVGELALVFGTSEIVIAKPGQTSRLPCCVTPPRTTK